MTRFPIVGGLLHDSQQVKRLAWPKGAGFTEGKSKRGLEGNEIMSTRLEIYCSTAWEHPKKISVT